MARRMPVNRVASSMAGVLSFSEQLFLLLSELLFLALFQRACFRRAAFQRICACVPDPLRTSNMARSQASASSVVAKGRVG